MKKLIVGIAFIVMALSGIAKAESLCTDWGNFNLCLPITTGIQGSFGYDFKHSKSQGLGETGFAAWNVGGASVLTFKTGGVTSSDGKGAPFLGLDYSIKGVTNPIASIATISPGVYAGRDFHINDWFYGVKASVQILQ